MGIRIGGNIPSLIAARQTRDASNEIAQGLERLASGLRINRAANDASGLALAERFRAEVRQFQAESANLQTGVNAVQTADAALGTQQEGVQRLRELAVQASNGTLTDDQRAALNQEAQQIIEQINATGEETEFNGTALLNGTQTTIPVGTEGGLAITLNESTASSLNLDTLDLSTQAGAQAALGTTNDALTAIDRNRASLGAQQNRFERAIEQREIAAQNSQEAESTLRDLDVARQLIEQTRQEFRLRGGIAALSQANIVGANAARLLGQ